jgi:hypothetical protein
LRKYRVVEKLFIFVMDGATAMEFVKTATLNTDGEEPTINGTTTQHCKNKKRLLKKAPDAPKRFKSAYICYVMKMMDEIKGEYAGDIKVG